MKLSMVPSLRSRRVVSKGGPDLSVAYDLTCFVNSLNHGLNMVETWSKLGSSSSQLGSSVSKLGLSLSTLSLSLPQLDLSLCNLGLFLDKLGLPLSKLGLSEFQLDLSLFTYLITARGPPQQAQMGRSRGALASPGASSGARFRLATVRMVRP